MRVKVKATLYNCAVINCFSLFELLQRLSTER